MDSEYLHSPYTYNRPAHSVAQLCMELNTGATIVIPLQNRQPCVENCSSFRWPPLQ